MFCGLLSVALSADEQRYALYTFHRHVFFVAGTVPVPPFGVCQLVQRALTGCTQKCINSGAKPAYCAAKHINHSSDQRSNEAPATNNAVVPRARR